MQKILKTQLILLVISGIAFAGSLLGVLWALQSFKSKIAQVAAVKEHAASYEANKKIFSKESELLAALSTHIGELEQYRTNGGATPELLSGLESLATTKGVDFAIIGVQTPQETGSTLVIEFRAKGSSGAIDKFLSALLHQPYQVVFTEFALSRDTTIEPTVATVGKGAKPAPMPTINWEVIASIEIKS